MKSKRYEIYVGLAHKDDPNQKTENETMQNQLREFFDSLSIPFSLNFLKGGYTYENGEYVIEDSVEIIVIGEFEREKIRRFAEAIKYIYHQESVLVVRSDLESNYVKEF